MIRTEGGAPVATKIQSPTIAPTLSGKWMTMFPGFGSSPQPNLHFMYWRPINGHNFLKTFF